MMESCFTLVPGDILHSGITWNMLNTTPNSFWPEAAVIEKRVECLPEPRSNECTKVQNPPRHEFMPLWTDSNSR